MSILNALHVRAARQSGSLAVFCLKAFDSRTFDGVLADAVKNPNGVIATKAREVLAQKVQAGYTLSVETQELYELLCGKADAVH